MRHPHPERDVAAREPRGLERECCRSAISVARSEEVEQRRLQRVRVDVSSRQSRVTPSSPVPEKMTRASSRREPASSGKRASAAANASRRTSSGSRETGWGGKKRTVRKETSSMWRSASTPDSGRDDDAGGCFAGESLTLSRTRSSCGGSIQRKPMPHAARNRIGM
jgi:hypothetical protein